jgi:hypothetical protein
MIVRNVFLILILLFLACSGSGTKTSTSQVTSSDDSASGNDQVQSDSDSQVATVPQTTPSSQTDNSSQTERSGPVTAADLEGSWSYNAGSFSGEMVFDSSARLVKLTNSQCGQPADTTVYLNTDPNYEVKIRQYNWCGDNDYLLKFAMNFTDGSRMRMEGITDLHLDPTYKRYRIKVVKR